jgi:hypothetical protein
MWRRIAVTLLCLGWGLFEFVMGSPFWGTLFAGLGVYCAWVFLFDYKPQAEPEKKTE